jgi:hypothetical protein
MPTKPRFVVPNPTSLDPVWPKDNAGNSRAAVTAGEMRTMQNREIERVAGSVPLIGGALKPLAQFGNALASPDTKTGIFTGPVNGISKLGNAIGDLVQRKPIDVKDAWTINDQAARKYSPFRLGVYGQEVTPSDDAGLAIGEGIGAEIAGAVTGATLIKRMSQLAQLKKAADALKATQAVRRAAVAIQAAPKLKAGVNVAKNVGEALVGTALAAPFLDQQDGNLANVGDAAGLKLPGRVEEGDNYLQAFGKGLMVEGIAAPLALIGAGSLFAPIRRGLANGDVNWIKDLADAELEPYLPRPMAGPALPSAYGSSAPADAASAAAGFSRQQGDQLNDFAKAEAGQWSQGWDPARSPWDVGGPLAPYDSAIGRSLQEQTQIRQVQEQRQRLQDMGLVQQGEGGQLEFRLPEVVEARRLEIEGLQAQREQLLRDAEAAGQQSGPEVAAIDRQITDLIQSGKGEDFMPGPRYRQPELDMPDGRPEADTALAQLDELDDGQLRRLYNESLGGGPEARNAQDLEAAQTRVTGTNERIADIQARAEAGSITPAGAKRMLTKVEKELATAQAELQTIELRQQQPQPSIVEQLTAELGPEQLGLNLTPSLADELSTVRGLQLKQGRQQQLVSTAEEQLRVLREDKAESAAILASTKELKAARASLADLEKEIVAARKAMSPEAQLRLTSERWRDREQAAAEFGYRTPDDYREALGGWGREQLRKLAMPESSPDVAALVLARTGRRVWQAKKADIIDALVEISERKGKYLPPRTDVEIGQPELALTANAVGGDAPLFDRPADLGVPGMGKVLDADGNEVTVPLVEYRRRGLDAATREKLKAEILRAMRDQDAIQPPITEIPQRPVAAFQQGSFAEELMTDPTGQLSIDVATGVTPMYRASGKNADALIEEMRLRFEYNQLDAAAQQAQRDAYLAEKGWSGMSWEEKKRLGILSEGFYSLKPMSERFREPTPAFNPELNVRQEGSAVAGYRKVRLDKDGSLVDVEPTGGAGVRQPKQGGDAAATSKQPADKPQPKAAEKAADQPQEPSKVGLGKAQNSDANIQNLTRQQQDIEKRLAEKRRQQTKKGGC